MRRHLVTGSIPAQHVPPGRHLPTLDSLSSPPLRMPSLIPTLILPDVPTAQRLLALGSRHWGSSSWWDTRSLLRIKIYDFAVYADPAKAVRKRGKGVGEDGWSTHVQLLCAPCTHMGRLRYYRYHASACTRLRLPLNGISILQ